MHVKVEFIETKVPMHIDNSLNNGRNGSDWHIYSGGHEPFISKALTSYF